MLTEFTINHHGKKELAYCTRKKEIAWVEECHSTPLRFLRYTRDDQKTIKFGKKSKVGTGGMDSKLNAATWALDRGVSVVICNGSQDHAIKTIVGGRKVGTFFTETTSTSTPVEFLAENGKNIVKKVGILLKIPIKFQLEPEVE